MRGSGAGIEDVPAALRFGARRVFKGRTVNVGALCDNPDDAAWLIDFLDGGTDPVDGDGDEGDSDSNTEDEAEGETPDAEPGDDLEAPVDEGGAIRQAFARMPQSLMRAEDDGVRVPDWEKILAGIKGQSRKQLETRCLVAEKRFRDNLTRDAVIQQATAKLRGRNALKARSEKHHAIWAAWRWLDRPQNQQKIADVVRQARTTKPTVAEPKPTVKATPARTDAAGVLLAKAQRRLHERTAPVWDGCGPSIMIDGPDDCHVVGPAFHRVPGASASVTTSAKRLIPPRGGPVAVDAVRTVVHPCPNCERRTCLICGRLIPGARGNTGGK